MGLSWLKYFLRNYPFNQIRIMTYGERAADTTRPAPGYMLHPTVSMLFRMKGCRGRRHSRARIGKTDEGQNPLRKQNALFTNTFVFLPGGI